MIEKAVEFICAYLEKEYETEIVSFTEHDDNVFEAKLADLNQMYAAGLLSSIHRVRGASESDFKIWQDQLEQTQPRIIFQIKQYEHPTHGNLYRCYLSSTQLGDQTYSSSFYLVDTENGLKIVARYNLCNFCNGTGIEDSRRCRRCAASGWSWRGGLKLEPLGKLIAVRKLHTPTNSYHLKDYFSEEAMSSL